MRAVMLFLVLAATASATVSVYCDNSTSIYSGRNLALSKNVAPIPVLPGDVDTVLSAEIAVRVAIQEFPLNLYSRVVHVSMPREDYDPTATYKMDISYGAGTCASPGLVINTTLKMLNYSKTVVNLDAALPLSACEETWIRAHFLYASANSTETRQFNVLSSAGSTCIPLQTCCDKRVGTVTSQETWRREDAREGCVDPMICGFSTEDLFQRSPIGGDVFYILEHQRSTAYHSVTCGCANPDAEDLTLINEAGLMEEEHCPTDLSHETRAMPPDHPRRADAIRLSNKLADLNAGHRSVPSGQCSKVAMEQPGSVINPLIAYDNAVLEAMTASIDYSPSWSDVLYEENELDGTPTDQLTGTGVAIVAIGCVIGIAIVALVAFGAVRFYRRGSPVHNFKAIPESDYIHRVPYVDTAEMDVLEGKQDNPVGLDSLDDSSEGPV